MLGFGTSTNRLCMFHNVFYLHLACLTQCGRGRRSCPVLLFIFHRLIPGRTERTIPRHEAKIIAGLVVYLLKQGYTEQGDITVLTPYLGQLFVLKDVVGNSNLLRVQVQGWPACCRSFAPTENNHSWVLRFSSHCANADMSPFQRW